MIIYVHGFASSAYSKKSILFKEYFKNDFLYPSLSYIPALAINTLEQLIEYAILKGEKVSLVGSSLGGFYCIYLSSKYNLKAVLINPAIYPYKTLDKLGKVTNYYDNSYFEVKQEHLEYLKSILQSNINQDKFLTLLQKDDEVLDYKEAESFLFKSNLIIEEGGNHSFENIDKHFKTIEHFLS
ncbi:MAG: esterase [Campylobacteraceae bacterium]|nr:esterase [Campylobacteraceae bacterium]